MMSSMFSRVFSPLLDLTVVFSFDRTGFLVHQLGFRAGDLDVDLTGKVCAVTGANSGLGEAAARALAARGAKVWLLCRDPARGRAALDRIRHATGSERVMLADLDLADLDSVRDFAKRFDEPVLDVLVHNAGILPSARGESRQGVELTFATNVVGPFLLTALLRPRLEAAAQGRIVTVSSGGMYPTRLDLSDWRQEAAAFDGVRAYSLSKRAEVVLSEMWAARLATTRVTTNAMHPGWADTPGVQSSLPGFHRLMRPLLRSAEEGADTIVWLAVARRLAATSGRFFFDRVERSTHWFPGTREAPAERTKLWKLCCELAGVEA